MHADGLRHLLLMHIELEHVHKFGCQDIVNDLQAKSHKYSSFYH